MARTIRALLLGEEYPSAKDAKGAMRLPSHALLPRMAANRSLGGRRTMIAFAVSVACPGALAAQHNFGWGPHFGSLIAPDTALERTYYSIDVALFSELAKEINSDGSFQRYNGVESTFGVTQFAVSRTSSVQRSPRQTRQRTQFAGVFVIDDAPSSFLQNDLMHALQDRPYVPRGETATGTGVVAGLEETLRIALNRSIDVFVGAGGNVAWGLLGEGYLHGGVVARWIRIAKGTRTMMLEGSCTGRTGGVLGEDWLLHDALEGHIAPGYGMLQCRLGVDASAFWRRPGGAIIDAALTRTSGLFLRERGGKSHWETLVGIRVTLPTYNIAFETWNDVIAGKDKGPTFGIGLNYYR